MGQHEDQVQEGGAGLGQTVRAGQNTPGIVRAGVSCFQQVLIKQCNSNHNFQRNHIIFIAHIKLNIDNLLATVNFIVTLSLTLKLVFISCQLILQIELRNNLFFSFLYKASLTGPPTLYLKYLQREMLKENCFQFPLTFIFDRPPRAIYCFIRDFLDI